MSDNWHDDYKTPQEIYDALPQEPGRYSSAHDIERYGLAETVAGGTWDRAEDGQWYVKGTLHILHNRFPRDLVRVGEARRA